MSEAAHVRRDPLQAADRPTCARSSASPAVALSSRRSRSSCRPTRVTATPCFRTDATSSSSPTRLTAASTTSSTASPGTCATPCRSPASWASPARRSRRRTRTRGGSIGTLGRGVASTAAPRCSRSTALKCRCGGSVSYRRCSPTCRRTRGQGPGPRECCAGDLGLQRRCCEPLRATPLG